MSFAILNYEINSQRCGQMLYFSRYASAGLHWLSKLAQHTQHVSRTQLTSCLTLAVVDIGEVNNQVLTRLPT